jgi:hypothetical protein
MIRKGFSDSLSIAIGAVEEMIAARISLPRFDRHKAFDADILIATLDDRAIAAVIPSKSNRKTPRACDFALYC